ncbi:hypothetical protein U1Q18_011362 [Sarracenia purpurea var. burkii]
MDLLRSEVLSFKPGLNALDSLPCLLLAVCLRDTFIPVAHAMTTPEDKEEPSTRKQAAVEGHEDESTEKETKTKSMPGAGGTNWDIIVVEKLLRRNESRDVLLKRDTDT